MIVIVGESAENSNARVGPGVANRRSESRLANHRFSKPHGAPLWQLGSGFEHLRVAISGLGART